MLSKLSRGDAVIVDDGDQLYIVDLDNASASRIDEKTAESLFSRGGWRKPSPQEDARAREIMNT